MDVFQNPALCGSMCTPLNEGPLRWRPTLAAGLGFKDVEHDDEHNGDGHDEYG